MGAQGVLNDRFPSLTGGETSRSEQRSAIAASAAMTLAFGGLLAFGHRSGSVVPAVVPAMAGAVAVTEVLSAYVIFAHMLERRHLGLVVLGMGYLCTGFLIVGYLLAFPEVFSKTGLFGANPQTAITLWSLWHALFALAALVSAFLQQIRPKLYLSRRRSHAALWAAVVCTLFAAATAVWLTTRFASTLPVLVSGYTFTPLMAGRVLPVICALDLAALCVLFPGRGRSVIQLWLPVAVYASMLDAIMGIVFGRYSVGWYGGKVFALLSSGVLVGVFVHETTILYRRLAVAHEDLRRMRASERESALADARRSEERISFLSRHDPLTGLANRMLLESRARDLMSSSAKDGSLVGLLLLDLDGFKAINDSAGQENGDAMLRQVARRLKSLVRPGETVARVGGDEFALLLAGLRTEKQLEEAARRILEEMQGPFSINGRELTTTVSIGVSHYPEHAAYAGDLIANADTALHQAKQQGRAGFQFFSKAIMASNLERIALESDLRSALAEGAFELHYQPIVALHPDGTARAEALLRWPRSGRGMVPPDLFIPLAERIGLMPAIGAWVMRESLRQVGEWAAQGRHVHLSINASMKEFQDPEFFGRLVQAFEATGTCAEDLRIEITESAAMNDPVLTEFTMRRCAELGVTFALDDFGTHYSSLSYLSRLPVSTIKIDKSFVKDLPRKSTEAAIIHAVIALASGLHLTVVAEGIETEEQLDWLRSAGCDLAQGFLFAKPMPAREFEAWIEQRGMGLGARLPAEGVL